MQFSSYCDSRPDFYCNFFYIIRSLPSQLYYPALILPSCLIMSRVYTYLFGILHYIKYLVYKVLSLQQTVPAPQLSLVEL